METPGEQQAAIEKYATHAGFVDGTLSRKVEIGR